MSSGDKKTTNVTSAEPPKWSVDYFKDALNKASGIANQDYVGYGGPRIQDFTPDQYAAFDMTRQAAQNGSPLIDAGGDYIQNALQGQGYQPGQNQYAGENPYLGQMIQSAQQDVTDAYTQSTLPNLMTQFNQGGAFGGTAHQQALQGSQSVLARQLGDVSMGLRNQDYNRQAQLAESGLNRGMDAYRMNEGIRQNALGMIPSFNNAKFDDANAMMRIGGLQQQLGQSAMDIGYDDFREWRDWDANRLGVLTNALGSIQGGTTSATGDNPNYRSAGQNAAAGAAILASMWGS